MFRGGTQARFWLLIAVLTAAALWLLKPVLLPFVLGLAIAYFLNPVVDALARRGIARWLCAIGVLLGFATAIGLLMLLILPLLQSQVGALVKAIPGYVEQLRTHALPAVEDWFARV
ncbi:MAG TPA: AI-2E family transporter, partial [Alphaproteobacteria bacterium]|nr:AI-2E family transporter [Alphaproteobacteria bacterium]